MTEESEANSGLQKQTTRPGAESGGRGGSVGPRAGEMAFEHDLFGVSYGFMVSEGMPSGSFSLRRYDASED